MEEGGVGKWPRVRALIDSILITVRCTGNVHFAGLQLYSSIFYKPEPDPSGSRLPPQYANKSLVMMPGLQVYGFERTQLSLWQKQPTEILISFGICNAYFYLFATRHSHLLRSHFY